MKVTYVVLVYAAKGAVASVTEAKVELHGQDTTSTKRNSLIRPLAIPTGPRQWRV